MAVAEEEAVDAVVVVHLVIEVVLSLLKIVVAVQRLRLGLAL